MKTRLKICSLVILFLISLNVYSQLTVSTAGLDGNMLGSNLSGQNITITNASVTGEVNQSGLFTFVGDDLGVNSGVILSTGDIASAIGPNISDATTTGYGGPGNSLLSDLANSNTQDAVVLQFDFEVQTDMIEFNYVFLSEEYNEYVNSSFNDVFAFYISGPGIVGEENLAVVPGTSSPVSINTINNESFWQFYVDNEFPPYAADIEFDGFTTLMKAKKTGLIPCETYTLKLMIADAGDSAYDAAVLLQENSLVQADVSATTNTFSENNIALEGCIQASFTFQLEESLEDITEIPFQIGGTAINGIDYAHIDNLIIIPAGQTSATIVIDSYGDGLIEGQETIELIFTPEPCAAQDTVTLYIDDYNLIEYTTTPNDLTCNGDGTGSVNLNLSGGIPPYYITLTDSITNESNIYTTNPIENLAASTYYVEVLDGYGCTAEDIVYGNMFDGGPVFIPDGTGLSYETTITISGFGSGQTLTSIDQIESICMNMEHSRIGELLILLQAPNGTQLTLKQQPGGAVTNMGEPCATGPADAGNDDTSPGIGYDYCFTANPTYGTMVEMANQNSYTYITQCYGSEESDKYLPEGSYEPYQSLSGLIGTPLNGDWKLIITDEIPNNNGWIFNWSISLSADQPDSVFTITEPILPQISYDLIHPDCGLSNGEINITITGESTPYSYEWSNGSTDEDLSGIGSGDYTVTITGSDLCQYVYSYNLSNNGTLAISPNIQNPSCYNSSDGEINVIVSGATEPISYNWSNSGTIANITDLIAGTYTLTVTDASSCMNIQSYVIESPSPISLTETITDENCGDAEGIIDISIQGGTEPYTYYWSNGANSSMIDELPSGTYYLTVTDDNECELIESFDIVNYVGNCIPDCNLEVTNSVIENEICGNTNGTIALTVFTSNPPFSANWSNFETSTNLNNIFAGSYTVTLTDAANCELIQTFEVINETGNLEVLNITNNDENCGQSDGNIDLTITGGAMPYTFNWSNGATSENLVNIQQGDYSVTITDGNYCSIVSSTHVENITSGINYVWGNSVNETCGNASGSIDIVIEGTGLTYSWSNGATSEDLFNLSEGIYQCVVSDNNGCQLYTPEFIIENIAGSFSIDNIDIDNEICGNGIGELEVFVSGGTSPYEYIWSTGGTDYIINDLSAGIYSATVTDQDGCAVTTGNISLINETGTLNLANVISTDEICNNSNGSIDITTEGGLVPYSYLWSNGNAAEDLLNIQSGDYSCTITDANGCEISFNTTVNESMGTLELQNTIISNETCGNQDGEISLIVTGGTAPIQYLWNNSENNSAIINLSAAEYFCTISDNQGCEILTDASVLNESGDLAIINKIITNETCGDNNGSINIILNGTGTPFTYAWSNLENSEDLTNLSSGTYNCTITDTYNCNIVAGPYTINTYSGDFTVSDIVVTNESCNSNNGSIDLTITGATPPVSYEWNTGAITEDISLLSAGTYTYTITDSNCEISGSIDIINDAGNLNLDNYISTNEICSNGLGSIDISVSGGVSPYSYNWSNTSTDEDLASLSSGNYIATISDQNGCSIITPEITISNNPGNFSLVDINITNEQCSNGTGAIDVILTGGSNPISYVWNNGEASQDLTTISSGAYSCTTTDANSCELTYTAVVNNTSGTMDISSESVTAETCGNTNAAIDIEIIGGTEPYTYQWSNGSTNQDLININSGQYTCIISDDIGCAITYQTQVEGYSEGFSIINSIVSDDICENNHGSIDISVANGTLPITYLWNNSDNSEDLANLNSGTYSVTIIDDIGCTLTDSFEIIDTYGDLSIDEFYITNEACGNATGAVDLTFSGGYFPVEINWSNGYNTEDLDNLIEGWYYVTITDVMGCSETDGAFIENITSDFELVSVMTTNEICGDSNGSINLTITGGILPYSFEWNNGTETEDLNGLSAGFYECIIRETGGCSMIYSYDLINETNGFEIISATVSNDFCGSSVGEIDLSITGGTPPYDFYWNNGSETEDISSISAGEYSVTVSDANSCSVFSDIFTVDEETNEDLGFSFIDVSNSFCGDENGSIVFAPTGGSYYTYYLNGNLVPGSNLFNLSQGEYLIAIESEGCYVDSLIIVENTTSYSAIVVDIGHEDCGNGTGYIDLFVSPDGLYSYNWSNGIVDQDNYDLNAGTYFCSISDDFGCETSISAEIMNNTDFNVNSTVTNDICGTNTGSIELAVTDAIGIVTFNWSNGEETQNIYNLTAGTYICTVVDETMCQYFAQVDLINETGNMNISTIIEDDFCGENNGYIELSVWGGSGNYITNWSNGSNMSNIYNLGAGMYYVTVIDTDNSCEFQTSYEIENEAEFNIQSFVTQASCYSCNDGEIEVIAYGGGGSSYEYEWSNGENSATISNLLPGDYTCTITDTEWGCIQILDFTVGFFTKINDEYILDFEIYPNPTDDIVFVKINNQTTKSELFIFNILGEIIMRKTLDNYQTIQHFDVSSFDPGIYIFSLRNNNKDNRYKLIIK